MKYCVLLVDGFNLVRRIYEARPDDDTEKLVEACRQSLQRAMKRDQPTHACVVFENHDTTWRHMLYADYKGNRKPTPETLLEAIVDIKQGFEAMGVGCFSKENYEADDVIATLAMGIKNRGGEAIILSTDKSYLQMLCSEIRVINHFKESEYLVTGVPDRYGVEVSQLIDYWALTGDSSNNIKGVPQVGKKTAADLLRRFKTLDAILSSNIDDSKVKKVQAESSLALRCRQLVTLKKDVELGLNLKKFRLKV